MQTELGIIAWRILSIGFGQWLRSGLDGRVIGLDLNACFARSDAASCDRESLEFLLLVGEAAAIEALASQAEERKAR